MFSRQLNDNFQSLALERAHASVIGGAPAAAVVFADVNARTREDPRIAGSTEQIGSAEGAERERLQAEREERWTDVRSEKLGELAAEFDAIHGVERAVEVARSAGSSPPPSCGLSSSRPSSAGCSVRSTASRPGTGSRFRRPSPARSPG